MGPKRLIFLSFIFLLIIGCEQETENYDDMVEFQKKVEKKRKKILDAEKEYREILKEWNENVPDSEKVDLSEEMTKKPSERIETWLKRRIQMEKPISYNDLADEIDSLNRVIGRLQNKIDNLEQQTGFTEPYVVEKGDSHFAMAMEYLMNKHNMTQDEAQKYIQPLALYDRLLEGFFVYFHYDEKNQRLHTSVNQGKASMSPYRFKQHFERKQKEKLRKLAEMYQKEQNNYEKAIRQIQAMRSKVNEKSQQLASLDSVYNDMLSELSKQSKKVDSLNLASNSLFYCIRSREELNKRKFYNIGFLGFNKNLKESAFDSLNFSQSIDLRRKYSIKIPDELATKNLTVYNEYGQKVSNYVDREDDGYYINLENPVKNSKLLIVH